MNVKKQLTLAFFMSLLSACGFALVAALIGFNKINYFDNTLITFIQSAESPSLTSIMKVFTFIGSGPVVVILAVLIILFLYKVLEHRKELILFGWVLAGSEILNVLLKYFFHRARPHTHRIIEETGYSFPSGHSMAAFALYGVLAYLLWHHISSGLGRIILVLISVGMIISIGVSRIYLGVHYPSDVIGGFFASAVWLSISIWFFERYQKQRNKIRI